MTHTPICHLPLGGGWEGDYIMKKTYLSPSVKMEEAETIQMLAESLYIVNEPVDGSYAFVKTNYGWNIWGEEEEP